MTIGRNTVRPVLDAPTLQWANGKSLYRETPGTGRFGPFVGFHIEVGKDEALDAACQDATIAQVEIKHQRQGGAEIVRHWSFGEIVRLHVITAGPVAPTVAQSLAGDNARLSADAGIGIRWGQGERSKLAVRGYLDALARVGHTGLVQLSTRSRMTDVLLAALIDHARVCEAADDLIDRAKHLDVVSFHEVALPLGPGQEQEWGKGDTATVTPFVSMHPDAITAEYLRELWRPDGLHALACQAWEGIVAWAKSYATEAEEQSREPAHAEVPF
jgi:hypothetical protein